MEIIRLVDKEGLRRLYQHDCSITDLVQFSIRHNPKTESGYDKERFCEIKIIIPDKEEQCK